MEGNVFRLGSVATFVSQESIPVGCQPPAYQLYVLHHEHFGGGEEGSGGYLYNGVQVEPF